MKICFLDQTLFSYNSKDVNSPKLRGAETVLINLANSLSKLGNQITIINNCPNNCIIDNIKWININNLDHIPEFDLTISNNDIRLFDKTISPKKILLSHSLQSLEKFIRKGQMIAYLKHRPKIALLSDYHKKKRLLFTRMFGHFILTYGVDDIFLNSKIYDINDINKNLAVFTSRSDRNLDLLIKIWKTKIFPQFKSGKLLITPTKTKTNDLNIFSRNLLDRENLINDISKSRIFMVPGHKAELFCLAAEEARELCVPIVTLGIGSLSERVIHGKTGFIAKDESQFAEYSLSIFKNDIIWDNLRANLVTMRGSKNWIKCSQNLINNI